MSSIPSKARVMIVDDSVVIRRLVSDLVTSDPRFEVVATAPDGRLALEKLDHAQPDIVILDLEMPTMDGLTMLRELKARAPELPVIVFSALTERAGALTLDALKAGASDYVTKPTRVGSAIVPVEQVKHQLLAKLHVLALRPARKVIAPMLRAPVEERAPLRTHDAPSNGPIDAVVIAASTGGPNALELVMSTLPATLGVPVFVVQHMPPVFTKLFADRLDGRSALRVREAVHGADAVAGDVWVAAGDNHLAVVRVAGQLRLVLTQEPAENGCRPAADVLFRCAARVFGAATLAVVLTGMGQDGLVGCQAIRAAGGHIVAQDEASSVTWGMPGSVARAGIADEIVAIDEVAEAITRRVGRGRAGARTKVSI